ncbi:hypothetical protein JT359_14100 [Candidatus Poribacteria bacterium]|nr:hypothetical protein [Candidatus Poribacteria bacterium]
MALNAISEQHNYEASNLQRIEKSIMKACFSFGMPPHRAEGDIVDLGKFPIEMRQFRRNKNEIRL